MLKIRHWLFDLDNTLYPASSEFFSQVSDRITVFIADYLHIGMQEAAELRRRYWKAHGTSLRGMMIHHDLDPEPFLAFVHDVSVDTMLQPDVRVRALLERCAPGPRHIFTNSPTDHARRVLASLQLDDLFVNLFDIRHSNYIPKPDPHAYERVLTALGAKGPECLFIDDSPENLVAARDFGMLTVWLRTELTPPTPEDDTKADVVIDNLLELDHVLASMA